MPKRGSRGFRWADLAPEHQKAVSHFTASGGTFPYYEPCFEQTEAFSSCLKHNDFEPVMCHKEKMALTACIDTKPMVSSALLGLALRSADALASGGCPATALALCAMRLSKPRDAAAASHAAAVPALPTSRSCAQFDYKLMRKARRKAKVSMRASLLSVLKEHPRTLKSVLRGGK